MNSLNLIQSDRGCTVGPGCEGECTCKRTVRLVLEGLRDTAPPMQFTPGGHLRTPDEMWADCSYSKALFSTALKEVG